MNRKTVAAALVLSLLVSGTAWAAKGKKDDVAVKVDPTFKERKIERVGFLQMMLPGVEDERMEMVPDMAQAAFQEQGDYTILYPDDLKSAAEAAGAGEAFQTLMRVWRTRRELDPPSLETIVQSTKLDAVVGCELTHWEQFKVDYTQEGTSNTTVGLKIWMWATSDRALLWEASYMKVSKSVPYNPSGSVVSDAGGGARQGIKNVPEPPEYEVVAQEVVDKVMSRFPKSGDEDAKDKKEKD